jgi:hypothetical protein
MLKFKGLADHNAKYEIIRGVLGLTEKAPLPNVFSSNHNVHIDSGSDVLPNV